VKYVRAVNILFNRLKMNYKEYPDRRPKRAIPVVKPDLTGFLRSGQAQAVWFGHSTVLIQAEGKTILCDPVLTELFFVFTLFTGKRFTKELPLTIREMPVIDVLLLSHDHYDHMDRRTILALESKVKHFCVPCGLRDHLEKWGIAKDKITELSYGETANISDLVFICTPSRHFSGRRLNDRNKSLWCSWVITGKQTNVFFSGDGAYGPHFKEIGDNFGPFDVTFMECGQANAAFGNIHMIPEKAVQAQLDLNGKLMVPIHWGMFSQSNTDWIAQVERLLRAATGKGVAVATPMIGEIITIGLENYRGCFWWRKYR